MIMLDCRVMQSGKRECDNCEYGREGMTCVGYKKGGRTWEWMDNVNGLQHQRNYPPVI